MRYNLGYIDKYPLEAVGSSIENVPMYRAFFRRPIDPIRLEAAVNDALIAYPLFATQVEFDGEYYLRTNTRQPIIFNYTDKERPATFGRDTNGFPWRIMYSDCKLYFEWLHGITDGMGGLEFFKQILLCYFGDKPVERTLNFLVAPGMEPFIDKDEKGINFEKDPDGFSFRHFPVKYKDYRTDLHSLQADTAEILALSRISHSSVAPVLSIIFSQALRMHLPKDMKNRNVACNIALDLRRPLQYKTMHNCVDLKRITYTDEYDKMSFTEVAARYKEILDTARLRPNIIRSVTERVALFRAYRLFPSRLWLKFASKIIGKIFKNIDCNIGLTYPGKIDLPPEVIENIENLDFIAWHDFGQCSISAVDYNGKFNLNICENFAEKGVVEDFILLSRKLGIHWTNTENTLFRQSHFLEQKRRH